MTQPLSEFTLYPLLPRDMKFQIFMSLFSGKGTGAPRENINNWITCNLVCKEWREILVDFPNMLINHRGVLFKKIAREGTFGIPQYLYGNPKMIAKPQEVEQIVEKMKHVQDINVLDSVCRWFFQTEQEMIFFVATIGDSLFKAFLNCTDQKHIDQVRFFFCLMDKGEILENMNKAILQNRKEAILRGSAPLRQSKEYLHLYTTFLDLFIEEHQQKDIGQLFDMGEILDCGSMILLASFFERPYSENYIEKAAGIACCNDATWFLQFLLDSEIYGYKFARLFESDKDSSFLYITEHSRYECLNFLVEKALIDPVNDTRIIQGFLKRGRDDVIKWLCQMYPPSFMNEEKSTAGFIGQLCISGEYDYAIENMLRDDIFPIDYSMIGNIILKIVIMSRDTKPHFFEELLKKVNPSYPDNEPLRMAINKDAKWAFESIIKNNRTDLRSLKNTEYQAFVEEIVQQLSRCDSNLLATLVIKE